MRSLLGYILLVMTCLALNAQTVKDFNNLKRSKKYFYAETTLPDEKQAKDIALINLIKQINDSLQIEQRNMVVSTSDVGDVCYLVMNRESGVRVLAYCEKVRFLKIEDMDSVFTHNIEDSKKSNPSTTASAVNEMVVPIKVVNDKVPELEGWLLENVSKLAVLPDIKTFETNLNIMKGQYKIKRYGNNLNACRNPSQSFIATFKADGHIERLLIPGEISRYDFINHENFSGDISSLSNNILWFQFSK